MAQTSYTKAKASYDTLLAQNTARANAERALKEIEQKITEATQKLERATKEEARIESELLSATAELEEAKLAFERINREYEVARALSQQMPKLMGTRPALSAPQALDAPQDLRTQHAQAEHITPAPTPQTSAQTADSVENTRMSVSKRAHAHVAEATTTSEQTTTSAAAKTTKQNDQSSQEQPTPKHARTNVPAASSPAASSAQIAQPQSLVQTALTAVALGGGALIASFAMRARNRVSKQ